MLVFIAVVMTWVMAPAALASQGRPFVATFGGLKNPQGIAINQSTGDVYVADEGNNRVVEFDSAGNFILTFGKGVDRTTGGDVCTAASGDVCQAGTATTSPGGFKAAQFVAVDNSGGSSAGDVYVANADLVDPYVSKFDAAGNLVSTWATGGQLLGNLAGFEDPVGVAVDSSGDLVVADGSNKYVFTDAGSSVSQSTMVRGTASLGVAVDAAGDFFKVNGDDSVEKFDPSTTDVGQVSQGNANAIAIDAASGDLYLAGNGSTIDHYSFDGSGNVIESGGPACAVAPFTGCAPTDSAAIPFTGSGIAVSSATGNVYVVDPQAGQVDVFGSSVVALPDASSSAATGVTQSSATLTGSADPAGNGDVTGCEFEYGTSAGYGQTAACSPGTPYSAVTSVTASLLGLQPDTTYHFRLDVTNANGTNISQDGTFTTLGPPIVDGESSTNVTAVGASLQAQVNPSGFDTTYHFEYGTTTSYGTSAPVPDTDLGTGTSDLPASQDITGLSANTAYHFRIVATNSQGTTDGPDQTFTTQPPAQIDSESSTNVATTTATLQAQINPDGVDTTYHFEYGPTTSYGTSVPIPDADLGSGTTDQLASQDITGLAASTTYHFRVVATNSQATVNGADQTFTTQPPATIDSATATGLTSTGATLNAQINPLGNDTSYHFEYGPTTSYGTSIPIPDADIGSGTSDVAVSQTISGLSANTEYHYRVIAANTTGTVKSPDHTFIYDTTGQALPDNRAYELITPPHKNGSLLVPNFLGATASVSADGSRVLVPVVQCFGQVVSCPGASLRVGARYLFTRASSGWSGTSLMPPSPVAGGTVDWIANPDTGTALTSAVTAAGVHEFYVRQADGTFTDVGPVEPAGVAPTAVTNTVSTSDLSHFAYQSVPLWPFDATIGKYQWVALYEYVGAHDTQPVLVGVSGGAGSTDLISTCGTELGGAQAPDLPGTMSSDGRTVFFTALGPDNSICVDKGIHFVFGSGANASVPVLADTLYARIDESRTVAISVHSPGDCTTSACQNSAPSDAVYQGASTDSSKVLFLSTQQLTDGASEDSSPSDSASPGDNSGNRGGCTGTSGPNGCNLYLYDFNNPAGHELVDISAGDLSGGGPRVQGVLGVSSDMSHVYFLAKGVLTGTPNSQGALPADGADNLYLYERDAAFPSGRISYVATLPASDENRTGWDEGPKVANVTPDGRYLVFTSSGRLTADDTSTSGAQQVFRYDAQTGQLTRISLGNAGYNDNGNTQTSDCTVDGCPESASIVAAGLATGVAAGPVRRDPTMSDDGSYVFFNSPVGLTAHALNLVQITTDVNGSPVYANNVYEWHNGHVYLISDGKDTSVINEGNGAVQVIGSDASGSNVIFTTADQLTANDTDTELDYYDARICTTSSPCIQPPAPPNGCVPPACQAPPGAPPPAPGAGSVTFSGPGNASPSGRVRVHGRAVRGTRFVVRIKVPAAGRVQITARGVRTLSRRVSRAGSYRLTVRLTASERRLLSRRHLVRLWLHVTYTRARSASATVVMAVTVKPAVHHGRRAGIRRATTRALGGAR